MKSCRCLMCVLFLISGVFAQAVTFYVSPEGDDSADGSQETPFLTIQQAVDVAALIPDRTELCEIRIAAGTYAPATLNLDHVKVTGAVDAEGCPMSIIDASNLSANGMNVTSAEDVIVENLQLKNGYVGLKVLEVDTVSINNIYALSNEGEGIFVSSSCNLSLSGNMVSNNHHGIKINHSDNISLVNNKVLNNPSGGIWYYYCSGQVSMQDNTVSSNGGKNNYGRYTSGMYGYGVHLDHTPAVDVVDNRIAGPGSKGVNLESSSGVTVRHNSITSFAVPLIMESSLDGVVELNNLAVSAACRSGYSDNFIQGIAVKLLNSTISGPICRNNMSLDYDYHDECTYVQGSAVLKDNWYDQTIENNILQQMSGPTALNGYRLSPVNIESEYPCAPSVPRNLTADEGSDGVHLSWEAPSELTNGELIEDVHPDKDIIYTVYRVREGENLPPYGALPAPVGTIVGATSMAVNNGEPGVPMQYVVTATIDGNQSWLSSFVIATLPLTYTYDNHEWYVDGGYEEEDADGSILHPFSSINDALTAVRANGCNQTIHVAPATYQESLLLNLNGIKIIGDFREVGDESPVIIDAGDGDNDAVHIEHGAFVWLENMTLTNGGASMSCEKTSNLKLVDMEIFHNCYITDTEGILIVTSHFGGGDYKPVLTMDGSCHNIVVIGNSFNYMCALQLASASVINNTIVGSSISLESGASLIGNIIDGGPLGLNLPGGIACYGNTIIGCYKGLNCAKSNITFVNNQIRMCATGGIIFYSAGSGCFAWNNIYGNGVSQIKNYCQYDQYARYNYFNTSSDAETASVVSGLVDVEGYKADGVPYNFNGCLLPPEKLYAEESDDGVVLTWNAPRYQLSAATHQRLNGSLIDVYKAEAVEDPVSYRVYRIQGENIFPPHEPAGVRALQVAELVAVIDGLDNAQCIDLPSGIGPYFYAVTAVSDGNESWISGVVSVNDLLDTDGDGLNNAYEQQVLGMDPQEVDTDGDGLPDGWEYDHGFKPAGISDEGLIAWWPMDELDGTVVSDASGNGHNGTLKNVETGCWNAEGVMGGCLEYPLDSVQWVDLGCSTDLGVEGTELSISFWYQAGEQIGRNQLLLSRINWALNYEIVAGYYNSLTFRACIDDASYATPQSSSTRCRLKEWNHVAGVYDGEIMRLYLNGEEVAQKEVEGNLQGPTTHLVFGYANESINIAGKLDDVRLYRAVLSVADVQALYEPMRDDDGDGMTARDEFAAGTDPLDASSRLCPVFDDMDRTEEGIVICGQVFAAGQTCRMEYNDEDWGSEMFEAGWQDAGDVFISDENGYVVWEDKGSENRLSPDEYPSRHYRLCAYSGVLGMEWKSEAVVGYCRKEIPAGVGTQYIGFPYQAIGASGPAHRLTESAIFSEFNFEENDQVAVLVEEENNSCYITAALREYAGVVQWCVQVPPIFDYAPVDSVENDWATFEAGDWIRVERANTTTARRIWLMGEVIREDVEIAFNEKGNWVMVPYPGQYELEELFNAEILTEGGPMPGVAPELASGDYVKTMGCGQPLRTLFYADHPTYGLGWYEQLPPLFDFVPSGLTLKAGDVVRYYAKEPLIWAP